MALLEAMACGLPVVCSDIRGSRDLMARESGDDPAVCKGGRMILKADDVEAYVEAVYQLASDPSSLCRMGQANARRAGEFDSRRVQEMMRKIYERFL